MSLSASSSCCSCSRRRSLVAWTVRTKIFLRRERCSARASHRTPLARKVFYLFTCEYCFSHWVTILFLFITRFRLLYDGWRGYVIAGFSLVWLANVYMSFFGRLRLDIREERLQIAAAEAKEQ